VTRSVPSGGSTSHIDRKCPRKGDDDTLLVFPHRRGGESKGVCRGDYSWLRGKSHTFIITQLKIIVNCFRVNCDYAGTEAVVDFGVKSWRLALNRDKQEVYEADWRRIRKLIFGKSHQFQKIFLGNLLDFIEN
jgi:hypothetical protein